MLPNVAWEDWLALPSSATLQMDLPNLLNMSITDKISLAAYGIVISLSYVSLGICTVGNRVVNELWG